MAVTQNTYTGDGTTVLFSFTFPYLDQADVKVSLNGVDTTAYTLANATTVQMNTAPSVGVGVRVYRATDIDDASATFFPGSAIRSEDLNRNFDQILYVSQETRTFAESTDSSAIQAQVTSAVNTANAANTTANNASTTANGIAGTANTALSNSTAAVTSANSAVTTANAALPKAGGTMTGSIAFAALQTTATTSAPSIVQLSNSISSTSEVLAATPKAVKDAKDDAVSTAATGAASIYLPTATAASTYLPTVGGTMTGNLVVPSVNGGPLAGLRNRIINGNFDIWQRGTSFTGSEYSADRWLSGRVGSTHTATRQAFTLGQTDVPNNPTYYIRTVVSSVAGASNNDYLAQLIEGVRTFAGQQVSISFWAKADATKNISVELTQSFGTGGSPSAAVNAIGVTKVSVGTTWQKITVTANVPSISGKTLGTDGSDYLGLTIWFDAGSNFDARTNTLGQQSGTFEIAQVQVEPGPVATPFEQRPVAQELSLCQRYYRKVTNCGGGFTGTNEAYFALEGMEDMRALPTFALASGSTYGFQWFNNTVWTSINTGVTFSIQIQPAGNRLMRTQGLAGNGSLATPVSGVFYGFLSAEL